MTGGIPFYNSTAETIPAGAVLEPTGSVMDDGTIVVQKCTADNSMAILFNSPFQVLPNDYGLAFPVYPVAIAGVGWSLAEGAAPATLQTCGAKSGQWLLSNTTTGFKVIGGFANNLVNVIPVGNAAGSTTATGFYAKLTAGTGPYSWTECTVSGGAVSGTARTGTLNATEATMGLTGLPVDGSVVVWMSGSGSSYTFNAKSFTWITSWGFIGSGSSCVITPTATRTIVISGQNLCGSLS